MRLLLLLLLASTAAAQQPAPRAPEPEVRPATRAFALTDARVVQAPGRVLERATVVVRDGRIEAVGPDVAVPWDAEAIAADTLTVYAGFIDGLGHGGLRRPEPASAEPVPNPGRPPRARAGLTPERSAADLLDPEAPALDTLRRAGFTAAQAVPHGGALPGRTALVLLGGDTPEAMVLRADAAAAVRFAEANGVYPATPMAVMATFRQLLENARRTREAAAVYDRDPAGTERPAYDPAAEALGAALDGDPVVFHAENPLDVHRALRLRREFGLDGAALAVSDPAPALDALREAGLPVFVGLALPDTFAADTVAADTPSVPVAPADSLEHDPVSDEGGADFPTPFRTIAYRDLETERGALRERRRGALARVEAGPARLDSLGIAFGFHTVGADAGTLHDGLRRYVRAGLSPDAALAALTTVPARALRVDRVLGTVEAGKLANLVVTDGPYFDDSTAVRMVFVDGRKYDWPDAKGGVGQRPTQATRSGVTGRGKAQLQAPDPFGVLALPLFPERPDLDADRDVSGEWAVTINFRETGALKGRLIFETRGGLLSGQLRIGSRGYPLRDIRITGRLVAFRTALPRVGGISVNGVVAGRRFTATATPDIGEPGSFTAIRQD